MSKALRPLEHSFARQVSQAWRIVRNMCVAHHDATFHKCVEDRGAVTVGQLSEGNGQFCEM